MRDPDPYLAAALRCPSPLAEGFDDAWVAGLWAQDGVERGSVKAFLATHQRIPGLGNGVLQDICWQARVHPRRAVLTLDAAARAGLIAAARSTLAAMVAGGGRDTERDLRGAPVDVPGRCGVRVRWLPGVRRGRGDGRWPYRTRAITLVAMTGTRRDGLPATRTRRREEILDAALALFDERGIGPVTTNHVAERAGISAGNLYYWFSGKPAILRALVERWQAESTFPVALAGGDPVAMLRALAHVLGEQAEVTGRYGALARELVPLLRADPDLADVYRTSYEARMAALGTAVAVLVENGLLRPAEPPLDILDMVIGGWVLAELGPGYLQAVGAADRVRAVLVAPLLAQLTDRGRAALEVRA
ncbi:TetR family transcriptional regulator [Cellulomonas soli]